MFSWISRKKSLPAAVKDLAGKPIRVVPLRDASAWLVVFVDRIAVVTENEVEERYWFECESASWNGERDLLTIKFIDPSVSPFCVRIEDKYSSIALVVRERLESSIVHRSSRKLASGAVAKGLVRRDEHERMFTQVFVDGGMSEGDEAVLLEMEQTMRDVVGLELR